MFWRAAGALAAALALLSCGSGGYSLGHAGLPGGTKRSFDQAAIDQNAQRLYLADGTTSAVDVFDVSSGGARYVGAVKTGAAPKGLAVASDIHEVFAALTDGNVAAIDSDPGSKRFGQLLARFSTGESAADLLDYDSQHHRLYVAGPGGSLVFMDALQHRRLGAATLSKGLEQPRWDAASGRVYVGDLDRNSIFVVDPVALRAVEWKLSAACGPTGMGVDGAAARALVGCGSNGAHAVLLSLHDGKQLADVRGLGSIDQVIYDGKVGRFLAAGVIGSASGSHHGVGIYGGSPFHLLNSVTTSADSTAVAYDERSQTVFQPDAHPGEQGVVWFGLPQPVTPSPDWVTPLVYALLLVAIFAVIMVVGRRRALERARRGRPLFS